MNTKCMEGLLDLYADGNRVQLDVITPGVTATIQEIISPIRSGWSAVTSPNAFNDYQPSEGALDDGTCRYAHTTLEAYESPSGEPFGSIGAMRFLFTGVPDDGIVRFGLANGDCGIAGATFMGPLEAPTQPIHISVGSAICPYGETVHQYFDVDLDDVAVEISCEKKRLTLTEIGSCDMQPADWTEEDIDVEGIYSEGFGTFAHELKKSGVAYCDGAYSLYGSAYYKQNIYDDRFDNNLDLNHQYAETWAHSEYVNASSAATVTIYMRDISKTSPTTNWGWQSHISLMLDDGSNQESYMLYQWGEYDFSLIDVNNYDSTATGADGQTWYVYTRDVPSTLDKSNIRVSVCWHVHNWYWKVGGVVKLSSHVDNVYFRPVYRH